MTLRGNIHISLLIILIRDNKLFLVKSILGRERTVLQQRKCRSDKRGDQKQARGRQRI